MYEYIGFIGENVISILINIECKKCNYLFQKLT
jgi:hypothetical protein